MLQARLDEIADPVEKLRQYVRAQVRLGHDHQFPGAELRAAVSRQTQARLHEHVAAFESVLRGVLQRGIAAGVFPAQDLDTTVPLVNACLSARSPAGERAMLQTEQFVLRAVGGLAAESA
jgi:hypothetical protein